MTADVLPNLKNWSITAGSNQPDTTDAIGPNKLAENLQTVQSVVRYMHDSGTIASAATTDIGTIESESMTVTGTTTITALGTVSAGIRKKLIFSGALTLTHNATSLILPGAANITTAAGDACEMLSLGSGNWRCLWYNKASWFLPLSGGTLTGGLTGTTVTFSGAATFGSTVTLNADPASALQAATKQYVDAVFPRDYFSGCTLSTAGASTTMSIAAGAVADSTNASVMVLAAIAKTTSAWAVGTGNGGLDTGTIAAGTWYHFWVIKRTDTGVVDVLLSLSATAPTMPASYPLKRYIGSGLTNGSSQWTKFIQDGDEVVWDVVPALNVNITNPGIAAVTATLSTPTGVRTKAKVNAQLQSVGGTGSTLYLSDLSITDTAPSQTAAPLGQLTSTPSTAITIATGGEVEVMTNTSSQIRYRVDNSGASVVVRIATTGWKYIR